MIAAATGPVLTGLLSVNEAAARAGISPASIRRLVRSGRLRAYRPVPDRIVIDPQQLEEFIHSTAATPAEKEGGARA